MIMKEKILPSEKYEVLSTFSSNPILMISGFLGGLILALLLFPLLIPLIQKMDGEKLRGTVVAGFGIVGLLGAIAAKLLQGECKINREAYKRMAEFRIPLVYPFFFLCLLVIAAVLWPRLISINVATWIAVPILVLGSAILSFGLVVTWRFWHILWLSILSTVDWKTIVETRNFNRQLKISFAEVNRYPSPLSLTIMEIDQSKQLNSRAMKRVQEELMNIIDKNIREADAIGRIEGGRVVITMAHTGSSGAVVQAERVKKILEEHLKSLDAKGERITLSIGISSYTSDMTSYEDLIEKAQLALCQAREDGGDRISIELTEDGKQMTDDREEKVDKN